MLTDSIVEEEFELKEEEPWYDKQDLEHDLQLAAELGKTLLERNRELEQGLQQMYSTNQEQLQEIEYLTKQVELLRQVNDQHAKVYEQLDMSARELEQSNHKLSQDNRASQQKIHGLAETVELLQTQVDDLQHQVEEMKLGPCQPRKPPGGERGPPRGAQSVSCLKELQNVHKYAECDPDEPSKCSDLSWRKDEQASLRQSLRSLQVQFASERARREEAEREAELLTSEYAALEQQLAGLERCRARVSELECEAEELRQLWKSEGSSTCSRAVVPHSLLSNGIFLHSGEGGAEEEDDAEGYIRSPWGGEWTRKTTQPPVSPNHIEDHECSCVRRAEVVKYRGISLLNEVDAQYSALQVKYDELLRRCHLATPPLQQQQQDEEDAQSHKAVQTFADSCPALTHTDDFEDDFHQPEYKELFREIFSRIRKTKEDLIQNRGRPSASHVQPIVH